MNLFASPSRLLSAVLVALLVLLPRPAGAYAVLSHEEVVDLAWLPQIVPLLKARFPDMTEDDLRKAHAYAYGGSIIQDIGYYPFGSHYFSDLLHYARTGDFVSTMIRESTDASEYAFALGALAHYSGDVYGHPIINRVTADEYPKLRSRFGKTITYDQDKTAHLRTEFGFDVVEVAHGRYSQKNYRDFIGFQVSKPLLERAFQETYGIELKTVLTHEDLAIGSYRRSVSIFIPKMTSLALANYRKQIQAEDPNFDARKFEYRFNRTEYEQEYGKQYVAPGVGSRLFAFLLDRLPKVGFLRVLRLTIPNAADQAEYLKSLNLTVDHFQQYMAKVKAPRPGDPAGTPRTPDLPEVDLDTGKRSHFGEYRLADLTYARLLHEILSDPRAQMTADVHDSLKDFYSERKQPEWYRQKPEDWSRLQADLARLDALPKPVPNTPARPALENPGSTAAPTPVGGSRPATEKNPR